MNFSGAEDEMDSSFEVNVISLVDVLLALLLFFMASTSFSSSHGINLNLPASKTNAAESMLKELTVNVDKSGQIFIGDKPVDRAALESQLQGAFIDNPQVTLILRADKTAEHGSVVSVMDIARSKGIEKIAIATVPSP